MSATPLTIHIDGAARGNPGPAAFAYVITGDGQPPLEVSGCLGNATNNVAEYTALLRALERARQLGARRLRIYSDSELLVKQMNGLYRVKNPDLQVLYEQAKDLCDRFDAVEITHVRREQNRDADRLCNEALDGGTQNGGAKPARNKPASKPLTEARTEAVRADALDCLRSAAAAWSQGRANSPRVEDVWDQLWSILEEQGVLRGARAGK
jgi:ribonuclease HI